MAIQSLRLLRLPKGSCRIRHEDHRSQPSSGLEAVSGRGHARKCFYQGVVLLCPIDNYSKKMRELKRTKAMPLQLLAHSGVLKLSAPQGA